MHPLSQFDRETSAPHYAVQVRDRSHHTFPSLPNIYTYNRAAEQITRPLPFLSHGSEVTLSSAE